MGERLRDSLVFVEFIGLPAAGKSTISRALTSSLSRKGINAVSVKDILRMNRRPGFNPDKTMEKFAFYLLYFFRQPMFVKHVFRYILRTRPFSLADMLRIRHLFGLDELYRKSNFDQRSNGYDIGICEDGFLQVIWSLTPMRCVPSDEEITKLLEFLCSRHRIYPVFLSADPQTSLERMLGRERPKSRIAFLPRDEALQRLERQQKVIRYLYQVASRLSRRGGLCIPASQSVSANVDAIVEEILKLLDDDRAGDPDSALTESVSAPQL